jgi:hypothetical protein
MDQSMNESLPKLLRAIASGTQAKENKHDIILNAAADEIEQLRAALRTIQPVEKGLELDPNTKPNETSQKG